MNDDDARSLEIAGLILDGKPVAWDTIPGHCPPDDVSDAWRVIADVADLHRTPLDEPVRRWGTLVILERIGHGTFGDVYRARDAALDRSVALKLVDYAPSASAPDEGRLLARVRHSNVVTVYGAAIHDGQYGIWMEFIRGRTLAALVREHGPLAPEDVTAIGIDVCRALTAVHESGLLHGDIKPQNVMREEGGRIVVMDFGTGRAVTDSAADTLAGTPLYLAPEVLFGATPDIRADIYSAGVLLYFLLTGGYPVEGRTLDEVRAAQASGARTPVRSRRPELPRALAAIIERAIATEASDRFESAAAFERELRESAAKRARAFSKPLVALIGISALIGIFLYDSRSLSVASDSVQEKVQRTVRVPLEYRNVPRNLEIVGKGPDSVQVRVRGSSALLARLTLRDLVQVLDLTDARPGSRVFELNADGIRAPVGLEVMQTEPSTVVVTLEKSVRRRVPVVAALRGTPAPGFIVGRARVTPAVVEVIGPESTVSQVMEASTGPISISGARGEVHSNVPIIIGAHYSSVRLVRPETAQVTVEVAPGTVERQLPGVHVRSRNLGPGLVIEIVPTFVSFTVSAVGGPDRLASVRSDNVLAYVDVSGLTRGRYDLTVEFERSDEFTVASINPPRVTVTIR